MAKLKQNKKYYFSVEGETEQWYLKWLQNMDDFKHENNFKRVLNQLTLSDVKDAIKRAKLIMQRNEENGYVVHEYKGYIYYRENPSLAIWEVIEKIM